MGVPWTLGANFEAEYALNQPLIHMLSVVVSKRVLQETQKECGHLEAPVSKSDATLQSKWTTSVYSIDSVAYSTVQQVYKLTAHVALLDASRTYICS